MENKVLDLFGRKKEFYLYRYSAEYSFRENGRGRWFETVDKCVSPTLTRDFHYVDSPVTLSRLTCLFDFIHSIGFSAQSKWFEDPSQHKQDLVNDITETGRVIPIEGNLALLETSLLWDVGGSTNEFMRFEQESPQSLAFSVMPSFVIAVELMIWKSEKEEKRLDRVESLLAQYGVTDSIVWTCLRYFRSTKTYDYLTQEATKNMTRKNVKLLLEKVSIFWEDAI